MRASIALLFTIMLLMCMTVSHASTGTVDFLEGDNLGQWYIWIKDRGRDNDPKQVFAMTDGIMMFNFFTCRERGVEPDFAVLPEVGG